jgi:acetoin utilization protein AcuB
MRQVEATVLRYMKPAPHTIGAEQTLRKAHELLTKYQVRHLPVLKGGKLVGILSQRDLAMIERVRSVDVDVVCVDEAMSTEVFSVPSTTPLDVVADEMADKRYGATLVVDDSGVVGILTTVDMCHALADVLRCADA